MNFLGNLFPGGSQPKSEKSPFEKWGLPPLVTEISAGRQALPSLPAENQTLATRWRDSIVIGLGASGHAVLKQWLEQTTHYEGGSFAYTRILSLSQHSQPPLPSHPALPHSIAFGKSSEKSASTLNVFLEAASLRRFYDWMRVALLNMRDIQVLIVGSAADPEISLLGVILQILRVFPNTDTSPYLNITALLALSTPDKRNTLPEGQRYAALREAGRFTFSGTHKLIDLPNADKNVLYSALLDHLFLFDESAFSGAPDFNSGMGQILSEILFLLNHPASQPFWENLKNSQAGELRQHNRQPFVHTLGIKTFFLPLAEMQNYLALRLARAVLFGERSQDAAEQFVPPAIPSSTNADLLARRWLTSSSAGAHPIFEWLWTVNPASLTSLPEVHAGYQDLYAFKVSHSLTEFLNSPQAEDKLNIAAAALQRQTQRFEQLIASFGQARITEETRRENLIALLQRWRNTAEYLRASLEQWKKTFANNANPTSPAPSQNNTPGATTMRIELDWKKRQLEKDSSASTESQSVASLLENRKKNAEESLKYMTGGKARFALTYNANAPMEEVSKYYENAIRPEVSRLGLSSSAAYRAVRNRLEWWVRLTPSQQPEVMVVCWDASASVTASSRPPAEFCYFHEDREKLASAIAQLAETQVSRYEEMTGEWYARRLRQAAATSAETSEEVFLRYDQNVSDALGSEKRHYYLAGKHKALTGNFIKAFFPSRIPSDIQEMDGYDPTRFTVLTARFGIPYSSIYALKQWYEGYGNFSQFHVQTQERIAAQYEERIFLSTGKKILFPPHLALALADEQLVTLFCQGLFTNLIHLERDERSNRFYWQIAPLAGFEALPLEFESSNGLFESFRKFTLEIPNDPDVRLNPSKPFHPNQRAAYLAALLREARNIRKAAEFKTIQSEFKNGLLAEWQAREDALSIAFAALLQVELQEPLWTGWY